MADWYEVLDESESREEMRRTFIIFAKRESGKEEVVSIIVAVG
jgi:hypothetical protein